MYKYFFYLLILRENIFWFVYVHIFEEFAKARNKEHEYDSYVLMEPRKQTLVFYHLSLLTLKMTYRILI